MKSQTGMSQQIFDLFKARGLTLSVAESCTGGLLSATLTDVPGISTIFWGTVVSYAYAVKEDVLGVHPETLKSHGAVSLEVAGQMAEGVRSRLKTSWSVAITGIAGPSGGTPDKPVGTVCFAVSGLKVDGSPVLKAEKRWFPGDRKQVREASVDFALTFLKEAVQTLADG